MLLSTSLSVQQYIQQTCNAIIKGTVQIINCDQKTESAILFHMSEWDGEVGHSIENEVLRIA